MGDAIDYSGNHNADAASALGDIVFPAFFERRPDGIFIDTGKLTSCQEITRLVDRIFTCGACFHGLDYPLLIELLYRFDPDQPSGVRRLADAIREIPAARRALYRGAKVAGGEAEYIFEPVMLETTVEEPVMAEGPDGEPEMVGMETRVIQEKASLDFDEFVADLWLKGIRYGIDEAAVRAVIDSGKTERLVIARPLPAKPGVDSGIEEQTPELHRDDAPRETLGGKMDLRQFKNRFPQMRAGAVLLKKLPRRLGEPGFTIQGVAVMPPVPKDFDLGHLAGPGTRIDKTEAGEFIVAAQDGFLSLDARTNQISITDKIVNRDGVSARTTGDLALAGEEYEEYGEVQERRVVEGKSITLHADVFGRIVSHGGVIHLDHNLVGGSAFNQRGPIEVAGLASGASLESPEGEVRVKRAESCLLTGRKVVVEWASNCTIVADEVELMVAEGCAIAGKTVKLREARARGQTDTVVNILTPDLGAYGRREREIERQAEEIRLAQAKLAHEREALTSLPDLQRYLALAPRVQRQEIHLSAEQQPAWQRLVQQVAPDLQKLVKVRHRENELQGALGALEQQQAELVREREAACAGLNCAVEAVAGDLRILTREVREDGSPIAGQNPKALAGVLRSTGSKLLFSGERGSFTWNWGTELV